MSVGGFKGEWLVERYVIEEFGLPISPQHTKLRGLRPELAAKHLKIITAKRSIRKGCY